MNPSSPLTKSIPGYCPPELSDQESQTAFTAKFSNVTFGPKSNHLAALTIKDSDSMAGS